MKSHIATAAITALIVGAASAGGATMLANHSSHTNSDPRARSGQRAKPVARVTRRHDPCAKLAHIIAGHSVSDQRLRRLMKSNKNCRAVVVSSRSPRKTVTIAGPAPQRAFAPAPVVGPPAVLSGSSSGSHEDDSTHSSSEHDD
jgi:hypothetical protein